jgi:hypothetical protein
MVKAWWFSAGKTLPHDDGRRIEIGRTHKVTGELIPCRNGLHASKRPLDALQYAPGPIIWRVGMGGVVLTQVDKLCASERTYIAGGVDATETLRKFARMCALDVIDFWDAPEVVVEYLKTGDEKLRNAARAATWAATWAAASDAASDATWAATKAAWAATSEKQNRRLSRMLTNLVKEGER